MFFSNNKTFNSPPIPHNYSSHTTNYYNMHPRINKILNNFKKRKIFFRYKKINENNHIVEPIVEDFIPIVEDFVPIVEDFVPIVEDFVPIIEIFEPSVEELYLEKSFATVEAPKPCSRISSDKFIEISTDSGKTWREPSTPPPKDCQISAVAQTPDGKYLICVGVFDSIYNSDDYGETWVKAKNQPQIRRWKSVSISNDGSKREAIVDDNIIYTSIDFGNVWERI